MAEVREGPGLRDVEHVLVPVLLLDDRHSRALQVTQVSVRRAEGAVQERRAVLSPSEDSILGELPGGGAHLDHHRCGVRIPDRHVPQDDDGRYDGHDHSNELLVRLRLSGLLLLDLSGVRTLTSERVRTLSGIRSVHTMRLR